MLKHTINIGIFRSLHLKHVGLILASVWVLILVAAVGASIYRHIDGPTVTKVMAKNIDLSNANSELNSSLGSARLLNVETKGELSNADSMINELKADLNKSQADISILKKLLQSYITAVPLTTFSPNTADTLGMHFVP